jgi:hypothetical protein
MHRIPQAGATLMPETDFAFAANYECEILEELPGAGAINRLFFPGGCSSGGADGILVRVTPATGDPWIGTFAFGDHGPKGVSRVLAMPDPDKLCVVAMGAGYIVSVSHPQNWAPIEATPVIAIRVIPKRELVVFANLTELLAYGPEGVRWRTRRLSWDDLNLIEVTEQSIIGEYWDLPSAAIRRFGVELASGASRGGIDDPTVSRTT